jgi:A/G-specific adenine glycosylase
MSGLSALPGLLLPWYEENRRDLPWRRDKEPYHVWLSEIMLQQTRVEAVVDYYHRFLRALPTVEALADADEETLLKLWEGLGYYNRARNLQKAAKVVMELHGGAFPQTLDAIRALPGIGPYTAGAIGSICFDLPAPAVDGNVLRVVTRVLEDGANIDKAATKAAIEAKLQPLYEAGSCGALTQALMELGACVCLPNGAPQCERCPLNGVCRAGRNGTWAQFPVRDPKKARRIVFKTVLVLQCGDRFAIRKRGKNGLLASLWEFPNADVSMTHQSDPDKAAQAALQLASDLGAAPTELSMQTGYTHVFTHVEWHMTGYLIQCRKTPDAFVWVTCEQLETDYALPSAFRPFFELVCHI